MFTIYKCNKKNVAIVIISNRHSYNEIYIYILYIIIKIQKKS